MIRDNGMIWYEKNRVVVKLKKKFLNGKVSAYCDAVEEKELLMDALDAIGVVWGNSGVKLKSCSWWKKRNVNDFGLDLSTGKLWHQCSDAVNFKDIIKKPKVFKVGDRVRLKKGLIDGQMYGKMWFYDHKKFEGVKKITNISHVDDSMYIDGWYYSKEMLKPVKTIKPEFFTDKIAVNCKTEKQARKFLKKLDKMGVEWRGMERMTDTNYDEYENQTSYLVTGNGKLMYGAIEWYEKNNYKIVDYKDILE